MAESKVSVMATMDSRLVREETAMESSVADPKVSMVASKEPVVFKGRKDFRDSLCPVVASGPGS